MIKNLIKFFFLILIILSGISVKSQTRYPFYEAKTEIEKADSGKSFIQVDNVNFIKNNEYFGPVADGYTLLGLNLAPSFVFYPNSKIKWRAGANFKSYYGRENELDGSLLLSFQYQVNQNFDFILGNIYGTVNHRLIEPIFDFERYLSYNNETGVQFLWNSKRIFADLWLNWEQQIFQNDPFQERFHVGLSTNFVIFKDDDRFQVSVPFQNLIRHQGGQINSNSEEPLTTIYNNAMGLSFLGKLHQKYLHQVTISSYWVNYQDLSPNKRQMYIDGMAFYNTLELENTYFNFLLGYWMGAQYIAPLGNPIYETYSRTRFYVEQPVRKIITGKLSYQKNVINGIGIGFRFETYYDIINGNLEYTWSILANFNELFSLKKN